MLEHLEKFECERGAGYLIVAMSMFAPGLLALFLLSPLQFDELDLTKMLVLIGAIGALLGIVGLIYASLQRYDPAAARTSMALDLVRAFAASSYCQLLALSNVLFLNRLRPEWGFKTWILVSVILLATLILLRGGLTGWRVYRKSARIKHERKNAAH